MPYEDVISLTEPNAIVAVGTRGNAKRSGVPPSIVMIPARGGLLSIEAYELSPKIETSYVQVNSKRDVLTTSTSEMSDTSKLSSRMEQAIYFGDRPDVSWRTDRTFILLMAQNPLSFTLPPGAVGDVAEAAEAVSADIVASRKLDLARWTIWPDHDRISIFAVNIRDPSTACRSVSTLERSHQLPTPEQLDAAGELTVTLDRPGRLTGRYLKQPAGDC